MGASINIYISYASDDQEDKRLRDKLEKQLGSLVQNGPVNIWCHDKMLPGSNFELEIETNLGKAHIFLLLISDSFINSSHCVREVERALQRHESEEVSVIPVLMRPVDWETAAFGSFAPLPANRKFIRLWGNEDEALVDVVTGIRKVVEQLQVAQQTAEGANRARLYETLIRLNFRDQAALFHQFIKQRKQVGAFLIHGEPSYGQVWLLNRLIRQIPGRSTFKVFRYSFQRKARGGSIRDLWIDLAGWVGMKNPYPLDESKQQEIVNHLYNKWLAGPVILMLNNSHQVEELYLSQFLQDFWQELVEKISDESGKIPNHYLLMFLIENDERRDNWSIQLSGQVDATWKPVVPVMFEKLSEFSEDVLADWIAHEFETLPPELTAKDILENSYDGTPEEALDYICLFFDCQWIDLVTYRLTS